MLGGGGSRVILGGGAKMKVKGNIRRRRRG